MAMPFSSTLAQILAKNPKAVRVWAFYGRIAQLVELLSYKQAVIGSSPFAPICYVVAVVIMRE